MLSTKILLKSIFKHLSLKEEGFVSQAYLLWTVKTEEIVCVSPAFVFEKINVCVCCLLAIISRKKMCVFVMRHDILGHKSYLVTTNKIKKKKNKI